MKFYLVLFVVMLDFCYPTFLLFQEKVPIFYCLKVCPLYCSKREKRDVDGPIYWEDDDELPFPPFIEDHDVHFHEYKYWKTTTTKKPTTTTKTTTESHELKLPYFIEDDEIPYYIPHFHYIPHWKTTTEKPTTTKKPTTTTTPKPTFICAVCMKKCGIPS